MAGKIIADIIEAPYDSIRMNVANVTVLTANNSGLTYLPTGNVNINVGSTTSLTLGNVTVSNLITANGGIKFPATQVASADANTLDDYEEGSWTPTLPNNGTVTYTSQFGRYTKIGNLVTVTFAVAISNYTGGAGALVVGGLPFTTGIEGNFAYGAVLARANGVNLNSGYTWATVIPPSTGGSTLAIYENGDNVSMQQCTRDALSTSGALMATVTYKT